MKRILWRVIRWTLGIFLAYMSIVMLALLFIAIPPNVKPAEDWELQLWIAIDLVLFVLTFIIFRSLFKKNKATEPERIILSARPVFKEPIGKETGVQKRFDQRNPGFVGFFERLSIRGIGIKYLTYFNQQSDGSVWGARWFTIGFLPIVPISVDHLIRSQDQKTREFSFVAKSTKDFNKRIEMRAFPAQLKRQTFLFHYGFTVPALLVPVLLVTVLIFSYRYNLANSPLWAYLLGGLIWWGVIVYLNENWNNKHLLNSTF